MPRDAVNGLPLIQFDVLTLPGLVHGMTTRAGGVSAGPFATLNLGFHGGDDLGHMIENRRRVATALGVPLESWVCARQVHQANVALVTAADRGRGALDYASAVPETDAFITAERGVTLATFTADCPLVALVDPAAPAIGLAHASWRTTVARIVTRTVERLVATFGCRPERMRAAIAPSAGPCCYEVGDEVRDAARRTMRDADRFFVPGRSGVGGRGSEKQDGRDGRNGPDGRARPSGPSSPSRPFLPEPRTPNPDLPAGRLHFDLWSANVAQLTEAGLPPEAIEVAGLCSICHSGEFFSYRASGSPVGHGAFLIALT